jgi:hypothetical protein
VAHLWMWREMTGRRRIWGWRRLYSAARALEGRRKGGGVRCRPWRAGRRPQHMVTAGASDAVCSQCRNWNPRLDASRGGSRAWRGRRAWSHAARGERVGEDGDGVRCVDRVRN